MKKKLVAGVMATTMMASVMSTGVFAKDLDPSNEDKKNGRYASDCNSRGK